MEVDSRGTYFLVSARGVFLFRIIVLVAIQSFKPPNNLRRSLAPTSDVPPIRSNHPGGTASSCPKPRLAAASKLWAQRQRARATPRLRQKPETKNRIPVVGVDGLSYRLSIIDPVWARD